MTSKELWQNPVRRTKDYWTKKDAHNKLIVSLEYPKDVDEELLPLLDIINSIPGVRTLYSCCGHSTSEFYIVLAFTSAQARSLIESCFCHLKNSTDMFIGYNEDIYPHAKFTINDFYCNNPCEIIFENAVGFYSSELGNKKQNERIKDYKRICRFLMKLVPFKHW